MNITRYGDKNSYIGITEEEYDKVSSAINTFSWLKTESYI